MMFSFDASCDGSARVLSNSPFGHAGDSPHGGNLLVFLMRRHLMQIKMKGLM